MTQFSEDKTWLGLHIKFFSMKDWTRESTGGIACWLSGRKKWGRKGVCYNVAGCWRCDEDRMRAVEAGVGEERCKTSRMYCYLRELVGVPGLFIGKAFEIACRKWVNNLEIIDCFLLIETRAWRGDEYSRVPRIPDWISDTLLYHRRRIDRLRQGDVVRKKRYESCRRMVRVDKTGYSVC